MKKIVVLLVCTLLVYMNELQAQVRTDKKVLQQKTPLKQLKFSKTFDYDLQRVFLNKGTQSKWVKHTGADKEIKVVSRKGSESKKERKEGAQECVTITRSYDVNSATFMSSGVDMSSGKVYPGAVYSGDDLLSGNFNRDLKSNRTPIKLSSANAYIGKSVTLNNPNKGAFDDAKKDMLAPALGKPAGSLLTKYRMFYSSDETMTNFMLSGGAGGYGVRVDASLNTKRSSKTVTLTIDAYKSVYLIDAEPLANDGEYFTELPAGVKSGNLVIINSVAYGTRIIANLTIECKSSEDAASLAASYNGFGYNANLSVSNISKHTTKNVTLNYKQVGGPNKTGVLSTSVAGLQQAIDNILNNVSFANAEPIAYNTRDLAGNNMGIKSSVEKFPETTCFTNSVITRARIKVKSGKDGKNHDNFVTYSLFSNKEIKDKTRLNKIKNPLSYMPNMPEFIETHGSIVSYRQGRTDEYKGGNNPAKGPYELSKNNKDTYIKSLMADGGYLEISTDHKNGNDNWDIDGVELILETSEGDPITLTWGNMNSMGNQARGRWRITKENSSVKFYFDKSIKAQQ